jgi:hypothetical protein
MPGEAGDRAFPSSQRFLRTVALLNSTDAKSLGQISPRIIARMGHSTPTLFSSDETAQIVDLLGISASDTSDLLDGCSYIFDRAAYWLFSAPELLQRLVECSVSSDASAALCKAWEVEGAEFVKRLKNAPFSAFDVMAGVDWNVSIQISRQDEAQLYAPSCSIAIATQKGQSQLGIGGNVLFECDQDELFGFLKQLDAIQEQIDTLV